MSLRFSPQCGDLNVELQPQGAIRDKFQVEIEEGLQQHGNVARLTPSDR